MRKYQSHRSSSDSILYTIWTGSETTLASILSVGSVLLASRKESRSKMGAYIILFFLFQAWLHTFLYIYFRKYHYYRYVHLVDQNDESFVVRVSTLSRLDLFEGFSINQVIYPYDLYPLLCLIWNFVISISVFYGDSRYFFSEGCNLDRCGDS